MRRLDPSATTEPDRHVSPFDDHGDLALAARVSEHFFKRSFVRFDIFVLDNEISTGVILTGRDRIRSRILAEYNDFLWHM